MDIDADFSLADDTFDRCEQVLNWVFNGDNIEAMRLVHMAFDPEHGVGVLSDGRKILGVGYGYDIIPYSTS